MSVYGDGSEEQALVDAALVAELTTEDRLDVAAGQAAAWDEGERAGRNNADDGYPDPIVTNPYRLAEGGDVNECAHDWTLRPESDTRVCEICGDER